MDGDKTRSCIKEFWEKNKDYGTEIDDVNGELSNLWGHPGISLQFKGFTEDQFSQLCAILSGILLPSHMRALAHEAELSIEFIYSFEPDITMQRELGEVTVVIPSNPDPIRLRINSGQGSRPLAYLTLAVTLRETAEASAEFVNIQHLRGSSLPFLIEHAEAMRLEMEGRTPFKEIMLKLLSNDDFLSQYQRRLNSY